MVESPELEKKGGKFYATPPGKPKDAFSERAISTEAQVRRGSMYGTGHNLGASEDRVVRWMQQSSDSRGIMCG
jgi:hypothetical protein